jgi:restriction system protein
MSGDSGSRGDSVSLEEWLGLIDDEQSDELVPDFCFPNERLRDEYLASVPTRSEDEVRDLLRRHFLVHTGEFGADEVRAKVLKSWFTNDDPVEWHEAMKIEYWRRLAGLEGEPAWQGLTWVLDLLPRWPLKAIEAIEAYLVAHLMYLPDGRIWGLTDAQAVIRAMWIGNATTSEFKHNVVLQLGSDRFEHLVESLYHEMGYETAITQRTRDGGRDIEVRRDRPGEKENSVVECKLWAGSVGIPEVRKLLGVVSDARSTKGILVTVGSFTQPARQFAARNHTLELLGWDGLLPLLDQHLGATWSQHVDRSVALSMQRTGFVDT